ncbi:hypothetical protein LY76DRAFT_527130 [Colletotrichum caudatum]|nr:hypothetical protein LY76DRAFT_527130 [Colletotrichum caudatum]
MRYSLIFLVPSIVPALGGISPVQPQTGDLCCSPDGVGDPSGTCAAAGLNSYCCSESPSNSGGGCDYFDTLGFQIGRDVKSSPPGRNDGSACGIIGFIGCAQ